MRWRRREESVLRGLVIDVPPPYTNGSHDADITVVVYPPGRPPRLIVVKAPINREIWLVRGTAVAVLADPDRLEDARLDRMPTLDERIAVGDPALLDPLGAARAVREAVDAAHDAAAATGDVGGAARERDLRTRLQATDDAFRDERRASAEAAALAGPAVAPDGRFRGIGRLVSASEGRLVDGVATRTQYGLWCIQLVDGARYATVRKFGSMERENRAADHFDLHGHGSYPVLVNPRDRDDVEVLWQEAPRIDDQIATAAGDVAVLAQRHAAALAPDFIRAAMEASPDAASRQLLAAQLREQGFAVQEEWVTGAGTDPVRLQKLETLRASGVLTEDEYQAQYRRLTGGT